MNNKSKARHPILKRLLIDAVATGAALCVFALFHHVLPQEQQSLSIAIQNPYAAASAQTAVSSSQTNDNSFTAAGMDDSVIDSEKTETGAARTKAYTTLDYTASSRSSSSTTSSRSGKGSRTPSGSSRSGGSRSGSAGSSSKGGSAVTYDSGSAYEENTTPLSSKFADQYTDTVVVTDSTYTSPNISVSVSRETSDDGEITYYIADIYLRDITCFQTALAGGTYGSGYRDSISDMAILNQAILAVNGDYYGNTTEGVVIRNGVIYRANPTDCDVCILYYDGSMRVIPGSEFTIEEAIADGAWQAWTFGPALKDADGDVITSFNSSNRIISANPRTAIGYYEPGHYCLIVVDGRGESAGITLPELSKLFYELGCKAAYNLDGGNSSIMVWQDEVINDPSGGGRESSDALLIAEVNNDA